jgi:methylmalonyl-CoA carboxyltransferase small subunit
MKLKINIDGKQYEADIEVLEDEHVEGAGAIARSAPKRVAPSPSTPSAVEASPTDAASDAKACRSTIVGIVVQVLVSPGHRVAIGDKLLVLEAMKMESNVVSTVAGVVKAIHVAKGDSVKKGQVLVEFE